MNLWIPRIKRKKMPDIPNNIIAASRRAPDLIADKLHYCFASITAISSC